MRLITKIARSPTIHDDDGRGTFLRALIEGLQPDPSLPLDEWSERYMIIPRSTGAAEYGKYRLDRTPHAREIMRCLSDRHPARRVILVAASQMMKTQMALNWFCHIVHQHPSNFLWLMPTGKLQKRIVQRIDRVIDAVPEVKPRVSPAGSRISTNSQDIKVFQGGTLYIATAGSAANLAEVPARFVSFDEVDRAELSVDGEGDPIKLAEGRQTTFATTAKSYYYSSPTISGESRIEGLYAEGTQRVALAECIHCGHAQELQFENLVVLESGEAVYPCISCGSLHHESDKSRMFAGGLWSEAKKVSENESFRISAMYQPYGWLSWTELYTQHLEAKDAFDKGLEEQMIVFYNTRLARAWKRSTDIADWHVLRERAEEYALRTAPDGVLFITAGVDTQDNRLAVGIIGWGKYLTAWVIDYVELMGDPADEDVWMQLTQLLKTRIQHASGHKLPIIATAIDVGGHRGEAVKNYVRSRSISNPIAIFGAVSLTAPPLSRGSMQDVDYKGKMDRKGVMVHSVGTVGIKHVIFTRLSSDGMKDLDARKLHFSKDLDDTFFIGLLGETYNRQRQRFQKKPGARNEPLDVTVYAYAATHHPRIRAQRLTESDWETIGARLNNPIDQSSLFAQQELPVTEGQEDRSREDEAPRPVADQFETRTPTRMESRQSRFSGRFSRRR